MDGISAEKTSSEEKNPDVKQSVYLIIMRKTLKIMRIILVWIFKIIWRILAFLLRQLLFIIFFTMLLFRRPIQIALHFFAGGFAITCLFFTFGYYLLRREETQDHAYLLFVLTIAIGEGVMSVFCMYASWWYDALLLRLVPSGYEIMLID
ncbi:hypothetical protein [Bartonella machadoae]|uniref:hypothetical protein n=1 Tax=Bartonella machadoae TaxID=2893471 RepID=UPI001F4CE227|nr:hypothetical protein [Bartonella machadoae]UNE54026.1 hypothetical protein LNM86_10770 [Bartonella machadoae]